MDGRKEVEAESAITWQIPRGVVCGCDGFVGLFVILKVLDTGSEKIHGKSSKMGMTFVSAVEILPFRKFDASKT